jgi:hypothetical protein
MKLARVFVQEYPGRQIGDIHDVIDNENHPGTILGGTIKEVPLPEEFHEEQTQYLIAEINEEDQVTFSVDEDKKVLDAVQAQKDQIISLLRAAKSFGNQLAEEFTVENMALGITQDDMAGEVLDKMASVLLALQSGSLHEAIKRIKEIPVELKDEKYITDTRLLEAVNKIEAYLGLELSQEL